MSTSSLIAASSAAPAKPRLSGSAKPQPQPIRTLSAEEIRSTLIGRSWQYTAADGNGFVTYNNDGTLSYQDDAKGQGSGTWSAVEGSGVDATAGSDDREGIWVQRQAAGQRPLQGVELVSQLGLFPDRHHLT